MNSRKLLIVMHGYGQLAKYFSRKFHSCPSSYYIVAPEGPHRFYKQGYSGRVGASWMTKEAREVDIKDNLNWLNALLHKLTLGKTFEEVILLGFSQGGATAARWYYNEPDKFNKLILWSSVFPPDITMPNLEVSQENWYVVGTKDEFINENMRQKEIQFYQNIGFKTHVYTGNHDINSSVLKNILS